MNLRIIIMVFFPIFAVAQAQQKINFQSVLRNTTGEVVSNSSVSLRISILSGTITGTLVYSETHAKTTDAGGLMSLQIGGGTVSSGVFGNINWGSTSHFIKLEADFSGGSNYVVLGTQELMSVPYALYASKTDTSALNLTSRLATKLNATDTAYLSNRIDLKAPINNPTFTCTVGGISKTMVGLSNVDNTSDVAKPISSATQTELSNKLNIADTSNMLLAYKTGLNNKLNKTDTSLLNLVSRFETKLNITDTSNMLLAYKTGLNNKLNKTDTASLSNRIDLKLNKTDTASLSERINTKLNSSVIDLGIETGAIIYWDENLRKFRILAPGTAGQVLKMSSGTNPVPVWGTDATTSAPAFSPCGTTISDIDGNSYNTVLIGAQCWTKENLRVRRYNSTNPDLNGRSILFDATGGSGGSSTTWQNLTIGAHTIYANDSTTTPSNRTKYGYLYNWYAAKGIYTTGNIASTDTLNICPSGWHVPTDAEWTTLTTELGGESVAGGKMKSIGTAYWNSPNTGATNESGFSALPGGVRNSVGSFFDIRNNAFFWSATELDNSNAWNRYLNYNGGLVYVNYSNKSFGASVRCLRNY
ncbi:MAG: fibrobacter succinogenes major paralogous domain-containing protein [Bacteroidota bacterium]